MYDTIHLTCPHLKREEDFLLSNFEYKHTENKNGANWYNLKFKNINIYMSESYIKIEGSLSKFFFGNNTSTLNRNTTKYAIEKLSDTFKLDLNKAKIKRIDIGDNLTMKTSVKQYFPCLGLYHGKNRIEFKDTLYYGNNFLSLVFYDKGKECKLKKDNLLRYEMRKNKYLLRKLFKKEQIYGYHLYNEYIYNTLISLWEKEYFFIEKINIPIINISQIKTNADAQKALLGYFITTCQNNKSIQHIKEVLNSQNKFRFNSSIKDIKSKYLKGSSSIFIEELNNLIHNRVMQELS